jgi:hypothetical protein
LTNVACEIASGVAALRTHPQPPGDPS